MTEALRYPHEPRLHWGTYGHQQFIAVGHKSGHVRPVSAFRPPGMDEAQWPLAACIRNGQVPITGDELFSALERLTKTIPYRQYLKIQPVRIMTLPIK